MSSFAEGLDVRLTGSTYRWKKGNGQWKEQWRTLHQSGDSQVTDRSAEEGVGLIAIGTSWPAGIEDVTAYENWVRGLPSGGADNQGCPLSKQT